MKNRISRLPNNDLNGSKTLILQESYPRVDFYGKNLGSLGLSLEQMLQPRSLGEITIDGKNASLGSIPKRKMSELLSRGFSLPRCWAEGCLGWIWCQWLSGLSCETIRKEVEFVVDRGMEAQKLSADQNYRCLHDLWLLHCAIFASSTSQLHAFAEKVVDSSGDKELPRNNGELFAGAWCGMLKHWILGDRTKAMRESEVIWGAYRYDIARAAPKPMVMKWLSGDWKAFVKLQQKDFKAMWDWIRKHRIVRSENDKETIVAFDNIPVAVMVGAGHIAVWHCWLIARVLK